MLVGIVSRRDVLRSFHQAAADLAGGNTVLIPTVTPAAAPKRVLGRSPRAFRP